MFGQACPGHLRDAGAGAAAVATLTGALASTLPLMAGRTVMAAAIVAASATAHTGWIGCVMTRP